MRDIKFRGKRVDNGEWVYGSLIVQTETTKESEWVDTQSYKGWGPAVNDVKRTTYWIATNGDFENPIQVDGDTVGQFTGLLDKNGVEIYESDRIKTPEGIGVVKWDRCFRIFWNQIDSTTLHDVQINHLEVIGNEFESDASLQKNT